MQKYCVNTPVVIWNQFSYILTTAQSYVLGIARTTLQYIVYKKYNIGQAIKKYSLPPRDLIRKQPLSNHPHLIFLLLSRTGTSYRLQNY